MTMSDSETKISAICDDIKELLIHKNRKYGNSALKPCRVFSKSSAVEQLLVRIDDEDVINDLIGYLVLLKIGMHEEKMKNLTQVFHEGFKNVTIPTAHLKAIPQEDDNGV